MQSLAAYIPIDRRLALARGETLPDRTTGAALFADISGFTPLTEALVAELGRKRGAEELMRQLDQIYEALIAELYRHGGSVIGFVGDAVTCWLDDAALCAVALRAVAGPTAAYSWTTPGTCMIIVTATNDCGEASESFVVG